jgi:hypothetical protein
LDLGLNAASRLPDPKLSAVAAAAAAAALTRLLRAAVYVLIADARAEKHAKSPWRNGSHAALAFWVSTSSQSEDRVVKWNMTTLTSSCERQEAKEVDIM